MKVFKNKALKLDWYELLGFNRFDPQFKPLSDEVEYRIRRLVIEREALRTNCDHLGREISVLRQQCEELRGQLLKIIDSGQWSFTDASGKTEATVTKNLRTVGSGLKECGK